MADKIKVILKNNEEKIIAVEKDLFLAYEENGIKQEDVVGIDVIENG